MLLQGEVTADDGERGINEHAGLCGHQEDVVQLQISAAVVAQLAHLEHADQRRQGGHPVERKLTDVDLGHGEADQLGSRDEHEEEDQGDDGQHQDQDAHEEALVRAGAVHAVMVRRLPANRQMFVSSVSEAHVSLKLVLILGTRL